MRGTLSPSIPMKKIVTFISLLFFVYLPLTYANTPEPIETLKKPLETGLSILRDSSYQTIEQREQQRELLWQTIQSVFDFVEIAKRTLARNWLDFSPDQRKRFTHSFAELLGYTYINQVQGGFQDETVEFLAQQFNDTRTKATVDTKVIRRNADFRISYQMLLRDNAWRVYDVKVEGVSLVKNYRSQFRQVLFSKSPEELIERLRIKADEIKSLPIIPDGNGLAPASPK